MGSGQWLGAAKEKFSANDEVRGGGEWEYGRREGNELKPMAGWAHPSHCVLE